MKAGYLPSAAVLLTCLNATNVFAHAFSIDPDRPVDIDAVINIGGDTFQLDLFLPVSPLLKIPVDAEAIRMQQARCIERRVSFIKENYRIRFTPGSLAEEPESTRWADTVVSFTQVPHFDEATQVFAPTWVARREGAIPKEARNLHVDFEPNANRSLGRVAFMARFGGGALERVITKEASEFEAVIPARVSSLEVVWCYVVLGFLPSKTSSRPI